MDVTDIRTHF